MNVTLRLFLVVILASVCVVQVAAQAAKPAGPPCSLDRQAGDWAALSLGKQGGADYMAAGTYHLNKDGTSSVKGWVTTDTVSFDLVRNGNTTIDGSCTLIQTWNDGGPAAKCVILDDGNEMWCIYDYPGFDRTTLKRIHTRN